MELSGFLSVVIDQVSRAYLGVKLQREVALWRLARGALHSIYPSPMPIRCSEGNILFHTS